MKFNPVNLLRIKYPHLTDDIARPDYEVNYHEVDDPAYPEGGFKLTWLTEAEPEPTEAELIEWYDTNRAVVEGAHLAAVKQSAVAEVNRLAEAERGKYITNLPGKIGEYRQKEAEFERWEAAGRPDKPDLAIYPIATLESVEYGLSPAKMLAVWGAKAAGWAQVSAQIAAVERRALVAIEAAQSEAEIEAALAGLPWS